MMHQYKLGGYNIVLDVCSGAVHAVDDVAYDMIAAFESVDRADVISAIAEKYPNETAEDIAEMENVVVRTVFRDIKTAYEELAVLFFGIDGVRFSEQ